MAMFRWNRLSSSFTGGLRTKGAASFLFSVVLADTKVHLAGCLLCKGGGVGVLERMMNTSTAVRQKPIWPKQKVNHAEEQMLFPKTL